MQRKMLNRAMNILEGINRKIAIIAEGLSKKRYVIYHKNGREIACDFIQDRGTYYAVGINQGIYQASFGQMPTKSYYKGVPAFFGPHEYVKEERGQGRFKITKFRCVAPRKYQYILTINKENVERIEKAGVSGA